MSECAGLGQVEALPAGGRNQLTELHVTNRSTTGRRRVIPYTGSARVDAVKQFARDHADDPNWMLVIELPEAEIYNAVKQTKSPEGAIRKVARMIGSKTGDSND